MCNNTYLQNVQIYKMLERIRFYPNRNIFDFRDEIFEKKKKKKKRNDFAYSISVSCVVRLIHIRIDVHAHQKVSVNGSNV